MKIWERDFQTKNSSASFKPITEKTKIGYVPILSQDSICRIPLNTKPYFTVTEMGKSGVKNPGKKVQKHTLTNLLT